HDLRRLLDAKRSAVHPGGKRFSLDQLHDQVQAVVFFHNVIEPAGVGMRHFGRCAGLLPGALAQGRVRLQSANGLQRDDTVQALVVGTKDRAHPAFAQRGDDLVRANTLRKSWHQKILLVFDSIPDCGFWVIIELYGPELTPEKTPAGAVVVQFGAGWIVSHAPTWQAWHVEAEMIKLMWHRHSCRCLLP